MNYKELLKWKRDYRSNEKSKREFAFPMIETSKRDSNIYIGDSGASCHMVNSDEGMFDCTDIDEYITVGNGGKVRATKIGKKKLTLKQKDGTTTSILMKNVKLVPDLAPYNLFSITWALNNGFQLGNKGKIITLKKGDFTMSFDQEIHTKSGYLVGVEMVPRDTTLANEQPTNPTTQENSEAVRVSLGGRKGASHILRVFGHMSEETT